MTKPIDKVIGLFRANATLSEQDKPETFLDKEPTNTIEIETSTGTKKVTIGQFGALDGWTVKYKMREYATTTDTDFKRGFTMLVLSQATVDGKLLNTEQNVNEILEHWRNIEKIFHAVLKFNNIDAEVKEDVVNHWKIAGAEMAVAFAAQMNNMVAPAIEAMMKLDGEK